jgi:hypothetical protein
MRRPRALALSAFAGIRDRSLGALARRERAPRPRVSGMRVGDARRAPQARPPSAGPRASAQPVPPPAAGEGALNVDLRVCGWDERGA